MRASATHTPLKIIFQLIWQANLHAIMLGRSKRENTSL
jgi:hypothetical protein